MGMTMVLVSTYPVVTHSIWSTPPSSPTMVGSAVETMVWSSEPMTMATSSAVNTAVTFPWESISSVDDVQAGVLIAFYPRLR